MTITREQQANDILALAENEINEQQPSLNGYERTRQAAILAISRLLPVPTPIQDPVEAAIALRLVDAALTEGLLVSVWDSEDYALQQSGDREEIMAALYSTGSDQLIYHRPGDTDRVGWHLLIYGNGEDLISDYVDNELCDRLAKIANQEE